MIVKIKTVLATAKIRVIISVERWNQGPPVWDLKAETNLCGQGKETVTQNLAVNSCVEQKTIEVGLQTQLNSDGFQIVQRNCASLKSPKDTTETILKGIK